MKVTEHIAAAKSPRFSFEIVPPPRGRSLEDLVEIVESVLPLNPAWIDVTAHASVAVVNERADGTLQRRTLKKRPGTIGICGVIQNRFKVDTVAHVLCQGFTKEETEDALIELKYLGIENVLALRGDQSNYQKVIDRSQTINNSSAELVKQMLDLRRGVFLEDISNSTPLDFCIGVAGYPEKHVESANAKFDVAHLKSKVDAGADYIVSQMFFDNEKFFAFEKACREAGIKVPIVPGLKVIRSALQIRSLPRSFHIDLPEALVDEVMASPEHAAEIGQRWAQKQTESLISAGHNLVHFYILNDAHLVKKIVQGFR